ncbi:hypothetical protein L1049_000230 [Liquidambar formosana]|uniref:Uncharacterized protein n=1 Tax=Liquidambar formosana TaxID=63359 RepID=A0AAP0NBZ0_LIQFO
MVPHCTTIKKKKKMPMRQPIGKNGCRGNWNFGLWVDSISVERRFHLPKLNPRIPISTHHKNTQVLCKFYYKLNRKKMKKRRPLELEEGPSCDSDFIFLSWTKVKHP